MLTPAVFGIKNKLGYHLAHCCSRSCCAYLCLACCGRVVAVVAAFSKSLKQHEDTAGQFDTWTKQLLKEGKDVFDKGQAFGQKVESFARQLEKCPAVLESAPYSVTTDLDYDDSCQLGRALKDYGNLLLQIESSRTSLLNTLNEDFVKPLTQFRRETRDKAAKAKSTFTQSYEDYKKATKKACGMGGKKTKADIEMADQEYAVARANWTHISLTYVQEMNEQVGGAAAPIVACTSFIEFCWTTKIIAPSWWSFTVCLLVPPIPLLFTLAELASHCYTPHIHTFSFCWFYCAPVFMVVVLQMQNRKFNLADRITAIMKSDITFGQSSHELLHSRLQPELDTQQTWLDEARIKFKAHRDVKMTEMRQVESRNTTSLEQEKDVIDKDAAVAEVKNGGWLFIQKNTGRAKNFLTAGWTMTWCHASGTRFYAHSSDATTPGAGIAVQSCCQQDRSQTDRRFCFEVNSVGGDVSLICQAMSESDRQKWMHALGSVFTPAKSTRKRHKSGVYAEMERGFAFLKRCLECVEGNYLDEHGLYRTAGVKGKYTGLYEKAVQKNKYTDLGDEDDLTVTSVIKYFLRTKLPEPVIPDDSSRDDWISAAQNENAKERVLSFQTCFQLLSPASQQILTTVPYQHVLHRVSDSGR